MSVKIAKSKTKRVQPEIVSWQEWETARQNLLVGEKQLTRERDATAAERRRMPWLPVEKKDEFDGANGKVSLLDLSSKCCRAPRRMRARAKITVQSSGAEPYDQSATPVLMEIRLSETFTGDLEGESPVRALQVLPRDHSASLVSVQRFRGKLHGREGTFVLQGQEIVANGRIKATWFVVPGSGTGELSSLRGEGGFEGEFGKGSDGTLDYWFE